MQRFAHMPINRKLTVIILFTCTTALVLSGAAMIATEFITTRRTLTQDMTVLADLLGRNSSAALMFHRDEDAEDVNKMLAALQADRHILSAAIYDKDQKRFGIYVRTPDQLQRLTETPPPDGEHYVNYELVVTRPAVSVDQQRVGTIVLRADLGRMYSQIGMHAAIVAGILLAMIFTTFVLTPHLRRPIAEPILALADVAQRVAANNDYSLRAVKRSDDEIGMLTDAFNRMLREIQISHDELAVAKDVAEAASSAKDQFLAVLSHELRTPLTPVLLSVSLLEKHPNLSPELREDLQTIRRHVELEARIIDDLLDLTRIARGKLQLNREIADLHVLLQDAIRICCADRTEDLKVSLQATRHFANVDPGRFLQVCWNVLNNAVKFTPGGKSIMVRTADLPGERIRIEVIDQGAGIDPDQLSRIFNAFDQGNPAVSRPRGGLGLGLAIARALVEAHGGTICAHSAGPGTGATFAIEVETVFAPAPAPHPPARQQQERKHRSLRILLVEDHERTLRLLTVLLQDLGHDVKSATNLSEALAIAEEGPLDLLISDLGLPDGSGLQLMQQLRDRYGLKGICISGFGMEDDIARSAAAGFSRHLTKPLDMSKLEESIEGVIS